MFAGNACSFACSALLVLLVCTYLLTCSLTYTRACGKVNGYSCCVFFCSGQKCSLISAIISASEPEMDWELSERHDNRRRDVDKSTARWNRHMAPITPFMPVLYPNVGILTAKADIEIRFRSRQLIPTPDIGTDSLYRRRQPT